MYVYIRIKDTHAYESVYIHACTWRREFSIIITLYIYMCVCVYVEKKAYTHEGMFIFQYEDVPGERVLLLRSPIYICMYVCVDVEKIAYIYEREYRTLYK